MYTGSDVLSMARSLITDGFSVMRFSRLSRGRNSCRCFCVELVKRLPVHRYSIDTFSYSGASGILGSDGKQKTT